MDSWQPRPYADVAIEVTASQLYNSAGDSIGGVGLLLRANGGDKQFVEFDVNTTGDWDFSDYSAARGSSDAWRGIDGGHSSAIHQGADATNRLAVIMRGNDFFLYANGAFLGVVTDSDAAPNGAAGLYVASQPIGGQFSDFAVYPLTNDLPYLF